MPEKKDSYPECSEGPPVSKHVRNFYAVIPAKAGTQAFYSLLRYARIDQLHQLHANPGASVSE